jgi:A1 cistron-splicing factor AAR2
MNQEEAKRLFDDGCILVILECPADFEIGIDGVIWRVGPNFKGIKMIPNGIHFIQYKLEKCVPIVYGFFHEFSYKEVYAWRWDKSEEELLIIDDEDMLSKLSISYHTRGKLQ